MKILIDIPCETYQFMKIAHEHGMGSDAVTIILNGTLLEEKEKKNESERMD